eukprot:TRINITY_DN59495_c0_g1_i1.p1 TRINITY_DN59495_c0_g1~~TRINITY_DN59495_c0_g1_i1.p1  ORF type:complete len:504 (-),score=95.19 TRINITY_DN59495_c0_g1_i1:2-1513(-)
MSRLCLAWSLLCSCASSGRVEERAIDFAGALHADRTSRRAALPRAPSMIQSKTILSKSDVKANATAASETALAKSGVQANATAASEPTLAKSGIENNATAESKTTLAKSGVKDNATAASESALAKSGVKGNATAASETALTKSDVVENETAASGLSFFQSDETVEKPATSSAEVQVLDSDVTVVPAGEPGIPQRPEQMGTDSTEWLHGELSLNQRTSDSQQRIVAGCLGTLLLLGVFALCAFQPCRGHRPSANRVCKEVEKIQIARGKDLQRMLEPSSSPAAGKLVRVEGRIALADQAEALTAPFSGRECVFYSASVSQQRHDSIHQPPLAYHSIGKDFVLKLTDAANVQLHISSEDVAMFQMSRGLHVSEQAFSEAPKSWCSFVLEHLLPSADASNHFKKCADLGSDGETLEFRECALLVGGIVTCVGELSHENGRLKVHPWQPQRAVSGDAGTGQLPPSEPWLQHTGNAHEGHWRRALGSAGCLVGSIMVSDNILLQGKML